MPRINDKIPVTSQYLNSIQILKAQLSHYSQAVITINIQRLLGDESKQR